MNATIDRQEALATAETRIEPGKRYGFFTDTTLCIGCKACEVACKEWNQLPAEDMALSGTSYDNTERLSATTWRHVRFVEQMADGSGERAAGDGSAVAEWKFTGVPSGSYRVSATWLAHTNRATDAPYTIFDDNTPLDSVQVNQQLVPGDFVDEGVGWQDLGGPHEIASGTLTVQLTDLADNFVIADAIRIEQLVEPSGHVAMLDPNSAVSGDLRQDHEVSLQVPADLFGGPAPVLDEARLASNSGSDKLFSELAESESPIRWEAAEREVAESWADGVTLSDEGQLLEEIIEDMLAIPLLKSARSS